MEQVYMSDNDGTPPASASSTTNFNEVDPCLTPNGEGEFNTHDPASSYPPPFTMNVQHANTARHHRLKKALDTNPRYEPSQPKPLIRGFERPSFIRIAIFTVLCISAYPLLYLMTLVAKDRSLFTVRLIVAAWCSGIGFCLAYILFQIGIQHLEAATWATMIHMSYKSRGMKFRDLAKTSQHPTSLWPAFRIFVTRFRNEETMRHSRNLYDKRPWSLFLGFILLLAIVGPMLPFLFGRIMNIETAIRMQNDLYHEILIAGDLSKDDMDWMSSLSQHPREEFTKPLRSLFPFGSHIPDHTQLVYKNESVYFAQPSLSQFVSDGSGAGFFKNQYLSRNTPNNTLTIWNNGIGAVLRYSQWGIRNYCQKLPNPEVNLIPMPSNSSNSSTYVFVPQDFLRSLFQFYGVDIPMNYTKAARPGPDDNIPPNVNLSTISYFMKVPNSGNPLGFETIWFISNQSMLTIETAFIRLNTNLTPTGRFPLHSSILGPDGVQITIGYDAAVCLQKYEPWVIETHNTSIASPIILRIVEKTSDDSISLVPSTGIQGLPIANTRYLNATGKRFAFEVGQGKSFNQMVAAVNMTQPYTPSSLVVAFSEGERDQYVELSPSRLADIRAQIDAAYVLPLLSGWGPIVARSYPDHVLAYVTYEPWQLIVILVLILLLGVAGELFVPILPLNTPRRGFGLYSWLALFQSQELRFEVVDDLKLMSLGELEKKMSDEQVKFCWD